MKSSIIITAIFTFLFAIPFTQAQEAIQSNLFPPSETTQTEQGIQATETPTTETQTTQEQPKKEGCLDTTALNYDTSADIHREMMCIYPIVNSEQDSQPHQPQDITGFFETEQVQSGATTWNMTINVNIEGATLNYEKIQSWNRFTPISATTEGKKITITFRQYDDQRLSVDCNNYEITIPRGAIFTGSGDKNRNPISGNFTVIGCQNNENINTYSKSNTEENEENVQNTHISTIKENNMYLSLFDTDENGKEYLNLTNIIYLLGFVTSFGFIFFLLFAFIKNSFLGKK